MTPPARMPRDAFADRLSSLASADLVAFVAALFGAREWCVEGDGALLHLRRDGSVTDERTVLVAADASMQIEAGDVDQLVTIRRSAEIEQVAARTGTDVSGPEDLYDLLLYGVDRETADALSREHLGRGVTATPEEHRATGTTPPTTGTDGAGERRDVASPRAQSGASEVERRDGPAPAIADSADGSGIRGPRLTRRRALAGVVLLVILAPTTTLATGGFVGVPFAASAPTDDIVGIETTTEPGDALVDTGSDGNATTHAGLMVAPRSPTDPETDAAERRFVELSPTCERPPELVAVIIVGALRENDPETGDGIRTAWNFSSRASPGATYRSFEGYFSGEQFEPLFDHRTMELTTTYAEHGDRAYRVSVTDPEGSSATYLVVLTEQQGGRLPGCWLLAGIVVEW